MRYTVKIIDGKPWVVEVGKSAEYINSCSPQYARIVDTLTKYPTLPEHLSHWQALEGKEFDEGKDFVIYTSDGKGITEDYTYAIPIPQPNEDEVWEEALTSAENYADSLISPISNWDDNFYSYLKSHYTISKK